MITNKKKKRTLIYYIIKANEETITITMYDNY